MNKRIRRYTSAGAILLAILSNMAFAAAYSGGSGSETDPLQIATAEDWAALTATTADWNKHFVLVADIDFIGATLVPIGDSFANPFTGTFDGGGHVVRNIKVSKPLSSIAGLFGYLDAGGEIHHLGVEMISVWGGSWAGGLLAYNNGGSVTSCHATGTVTGYSAGGLLGMNAVDGTVTSCHALATVTGDGHAGGLVGVNSGDIVACYAAGTVSGDWAVGGLAGSNDGVITSSYATGASTGNQAVGGLVGDNFMGAIIASYATGFVSGTTDLGGLVGYTGYYGQVIRAYGTLFGCFWDRESSGRNNSFGGGKGLSADQMRTVAFFQNAGWSGYPWVMREGDLPRLSWEESGWPAIPEPDPAPWAGSGTEADPFQIATAADFVLLSSHTSVLDKHIRLTADIDLTGVTLFPIGDLGHFNGVFEGDGHVLTGGQMVMPDNDHVGLFSYVGESGVIRNLGMDTMLVKGSRFVGCLAGFNHGVIKSCHTNGTVTGKEYLGGLAGLNWGRMETCRAMGAVTGDEQSHTVGGLTGCNEGGVLDACRAAGTVKGNDVVGGLLGRNGWEICEEWGCRGEGSVTRCYAAAAVTGNKRAGGLAGLNWGDIHSCCSFGAVSGADSLHSGGLVGYNGYGGTLATCYARGEVVGNENAGGLAGYNDDGSLITSCYAAGKVSGTQNTGGLVGWTAGPVETSYWDRDASGQATSAGGEGRSTEAMTWPHDATTYEEWDFTTTWVADADHAVNNGYPYLAGNIPDMFVPAICIDHQENKCMTPECYTFSDCSYGAEVLHRHWAINGNARNGDADIFECFDYSDMYTVTLTLVTDQRTYTVSEELYVEVAPAWGSYDAYFEVDSHAGQAPFTVQFTDLSAVEGECMEVHWEWNFDDVYTCQDCEGSSFTHTFLTPGTYNVCLHTECFEPECGSKKDLSKDMDWCEVITVLESEGEGEAGEGENPAIHAADTNGDSRIVMGEAIAYLTGWQLGGNPMNYAIRGAYIWQNGERYIYDAGQIPPLCWVLEP